MAMHADQLPVTTGTVRSLVGGQFPEWRDLPVRELRTQGTVNAIFRIGEALAARFPLQPAGVEATRRALVAEADATRELLGATRFAVPEPVAIGEPGHGYPLPWSVQTWLPGVTASEEDPGASKAFAHDLAELIGELRARNVLVAEGRLAGVLDAGGFGEALACDDLEWERGRAWALEQAMGVVWYYADSNPAMSRMGRRTLERVS